MAGEIERKRSTRRDVEAFLNKVARTPARGGGQGRIVFAMDATASRQPSWDNACAIQAEMFEAVRGLGNLSIQLVFYRGFGECKASRWHNDAGALLKSMLAVRCLGGRTQIAKILRHALREHKKKPVQAVIFIGDCMEEDADSLCDLAGHMGLAGLPLFIFHEGGEPAAATCFRQMSKLSGGAYCPFDPSSPEALKSLLGAVAVYAAGGRRALENLAKTRGGPVALLSRQL